MKEMMFDFPNNKFIAVDRRTVGDHWNRTLCQKRKEAKRSKATPNTSRLFHFISSSSKSKKKRIKYECHRE
jgi:hypothetical protein